MSITMKSAGSRRICSPPILDIGGLPDEITYALDTLKLDGICLLTTVNDHYPVDPKFDTIFEELDRRGAVVFAHPNDPPYGAVTHTGLPAGMCESILETTRMVGNLLYSGALDRCRLSPGQSPFFNTDGQTGF
jgi:6-methylsalicylate decarboxylase